MTESRGRLGVSGKADPDRCLEALTFVPDHGCGRVLLQGLNLTRCAKSEVVVLE
ncbi:MAG: hypothetical protein ACF8PN_09465 [Phycisphaerales bacterium]